MGVTYTPCDLYSGKYGILYTVYNNIDRKCLHEFNFADIFYMNTIEHAC